MPFVAWPGPALPGWAGSLDLVVVLAPDGADSGTASAVSEAVRRGCQVVVSCPPGSLVAEHTVGRYATVLPSTTRDQLASAVVMLSYLHRVQLGPETAPDSVADALDEALRMPDLEREVMELAAREHARQFDRLAVFDRLLARLPTRERALLGAS